MTDTTTPLEHNVRTMHKMCLLCKESRACAHDSSARMAQIQRWRATYLRADIRNSSHVIVPDTRKWLCAFMCKRLLHAIVDWKF